MRAVFQLLAVTTLGLLACTATAADAPPASATKVEKPIVFLDKSPVIVKYQLGRLSNEQLLLVDRETSHPKFIPLWETILVRPGMAAKFRSEAADALAKLNKSDASAELLAGIQRAPAGQPAVLADLSKLLVTQKPEDLRKSQPGLEALAGGDGPAAARQAAFAALIGIQPADTLWAFALGKPGALAQLLAGIPLAPDAAKRSAFAAKVLPLLTPGTDAATRKAAIAAAAKLPGSEPAAFTALARLVTTGTEVPSAARALLALPRGSWPDAALLKPLADTLLEQAKKIPVPQRTQDDFLDIQQLGFQLAAKLPKETTLQTRKSFSSLGVNVLRLGTLHEQMFFDKVQLVAEAGKPVELIFHNSDAMQHNWVLTQTGAVDDIGLAAEKLPPQPDSQGRLYVPASPKVLQATKMLNPDDTVRLRFDAPKEPGDYPYLCTYPGHWQRMRGILKVVPDLDAYLAQGHTEPAAPVITEWKLADLAADLHQLGAGRNFAKGKSLFTTVGCIACHKVGADGVLWGPELTGVFAKYKDDPQAVLVEILEPSKNLETRHRPIEFTLGDDEPFTGFLVKDDGETLTIQTGPGEAMMKKLPKKDLKSRAQSLSIMPPGLLNLLNKEQILDLLAFLKSGGDPKHP
ncbi:MAG: c-type cytochrome [Verrucomicrobia bacterium]|nr:c-type cytochrome [Verrucomicrobiota bacterium]